jgi:hypothetical protein
MKRELLVGLIGVFMICVVLIFMTFAQSTEKENVSTTNVGQNQIDVENENIDDSNSDEKQNNEEFESEAKKLIKNQFEYFHSIVNGGYFVDSRKNGPKDNYSDAWVSESVKQELQERAVEIDELLPENAGSGDSLTQDLLQVLIRINQAYSQTDSQKNIYHVYKNLYELHVSLNGYELEEGSFDPETDWNQVFTEEEEEQEVKTEAELKAELEAAIEAEGNVK